jgi:hypothetical protein
MKTGPDELGVVENESSNAKHENWTWRPKYRRKWVRECKTWKLDSAQTLLKMSLAAQNKKTGHDALSTTENESATAKHENLTQSPRYRRKWLRERKTWKMDMELSVPPKTNLEAQNMKTRPETLGAIENDSGTSKHEKLTWRPRYSPKRIWKWKIIKNWPNVLGPTEKESRSKIWKLDPMHSVPPETCLEVQNMTTRLGALDTAENEFESSKHKKWTWRPQYRWKWVWKRKTWKLDSTPSIRAKTSLGVKNHKN